MKDNYIKFIFEKKKLLKNYYEYKKLGNIYYPLKTNSNSYIIDNLNNNYCEEDGFLISSINHYKLLVKHNISPRKMCFINVLASNDSIKYLYNHGVRFFVFDSYETLVNFSFYADLSTCKIAIRLNLMNIYPYIFTHLGASISDCIKMLDYLNKRCLKLGISFYILPELKDNNNSMFKIIDYIKKTFNNYNLSFISIGGLQNYTKLDYKYFKELKRIMNLDEIILEPGKYLVDNTFYLKTKIVQEKSLDNRDIVVIKNGIYSGLLDILLYNKKFDFYLKVNTDYIPITYKKDGNHQYEFVMCGASNDSRDIIGKMYLDEKYKNNLVVGGEVMIKNIGSYFEEFFMNYGGDIEKVYEEVEENEI